jgi:hypothetical protein
VTCGLFFQIVWLFYWYPQTDFFLYSSLRNIEICDGDGGGAALPCNNTTKTTKPFMATLQADFLTFLRIPKTGSTSLLSFFQEYSGMASLDQKLLLENRSNLPQPGLLPCSFGKTSSFRNDNVSKGNGHVCDHIAYSEMMKNWFRAIDVWIDQEFDREPNVKFLNVSMEMLTIVRNPFDRLRSYFDYCHGRVEREVWKTMNTEAQYAKVREGDFASWIELVYKENHIPSNAQFRYLDDNVDQAIALISGDSPNVTVLVNECFEASLLFMERKFGLANVGRFLSTPKVRSNVSVRRNDTADLVYLREQSELHLVDEYKFYNAAVKQFEKQVSSIDPLLLVGCDIII